MQKLSILARLKSLVFQSSTRNLLLSAVAAALLLRLVLVVFISDPKAIISDPRHHLLYEHGIIAHNLYMGHGFAMHWPYESQLAERRAIVAQPPAFEGAFLPPLSPYLLFASYSVFGETASALYAMMLLLAIVNAFTVIPIYRLGALLGSEAAGRISVIVFLLFLPAAYSVITFSGSALYQFLGAFVILAAVRVAMTATWRNVLVLAAACGVMTSLRSEFFFLEFILIAVCLGVAWLRTRQAILVKALASFALCAAIVAPWTYRNYSLYHRFIPVLSHPWYELWRGNNPLATGTTLDAQGNATWITAHNYPALVQRMDSIPYDQQFEAKVDGLFKEAVIQFATQHPVDFARLCAIKLGYFFTIDPNYPSTHNPLFFLPMLSVSLLTIAAFVTLARNVDKRTLALVLFTVFGTYLVMTALTLALSRYQIYVFTILLGMTGLPLERYVTSEKVVNRTA